MKGPPDTRRGLVAANHQTPELGDQTSRTIPRPTLTGNRCRCSACNDCFNSPSVFDAHRVGPHGAGRSCLTAEEMQAKGWSRNAAGFWIRAELDAGAIRKRQNSRLPAGGIHAEGVAA